MAWKCFQQAWEKLCPFSSPSPLHLILTQAVAALSGGWKLKKCQLSGFFLFILCFKKLSPREQKDFFVAICAQTLKLSESALSTGVAITAPASLERMKLLILSSASAQLCLQQGQHKDGDGDK